jgi:hypothetical protein
MFCERFLKDYGARMVEFQRLSEQPFEARYFALFVENAESLGKPSF